MFWKSGKNGQPDRKEEEMERAYAVKRRMLDGETRLDIETISRYRVDSLAAAKAIDEKSPDWAATYPQAGIAIVEIREVD